MTVEMKFEPVQAAPGSKVNFGVTVTGADLNNISGTFIRLDMMFNNSFQC